MNVASWTSTIFNGEYVCFHGGGSMAESHRKKAMVGKPKIIQGWRADEPYIKKNTEFSIVAVVF